MMETKFGTEHGFIIGDMAASTSGGTASVGFAEQGGQKLEEASRAVTTNKN